MLAVLDMMTRMRIHLLCICDGRATQAEVTQALHKCGAAKSFKAYGYDGAKVLWLISSGLAVRVLGCLKPSKDKDWTSALLLTGKGKVRTLVLGMYGVPGATTSAEASGRQKERLDWVSQIARKHQGAKHQLVVLGDLNMVPTPALHSSHSLEKGTMRMFQQFLDDHELENALLTRIPEPTLKEGVFSYSDPLKQGSPRSLLGHVLVTTGRTRAAGVLIWPANPRPDAWADHDAIIADIDLRSPAALQATSRIGPKAAHMLSPSQWHNLGQNARVRQELSTIKEHLSGECEQGVLNDLFDRFLKIGTPKAAIKETTPKASCQGPLYHILHSILGQLRASNAYIRRCLQQAERQGAGQVTMDSAKLAAVLCRHKDAEGTGIYDNLALGGLLTWEDNWSPGRWGEWPQQVKVAKKFVQRTLKAAQKLWVMEGAELRRGQAIAEARSGKLAAVIDLIFIPDKPSMVDDCVWQERKTETPGGMEAHWELITEPAELETAALDIARAIFPTSRDWHPEETNPHSTFPAGFAFGGCAIASAELTDMLTSSERVDFAGVLAKMSMDEFVGLIQARNMNSAPGSSELRYDHLRAMSEAHREVCLLFVNKYIMTQSCPAVWLLVTIAMIPKGTGGGGLGAGRPISLIETPLKLATAWVIPRVKARMLQHRRPEGPQAPSPAEGWAERGQFFDSGGSGRGCIQAVVTVASVIEGLTTLNQDFAYVALDVKAAFPSVPTEFMERTYSGMGMEGTDELDGLRQFLQSIDRKSTMRVRVHHGFSVAILKGLIGIHQGEVSSPMKYGISTDTLLRYLAFLADQHDAGISLTTIHFAGQKLPFEGTLTIETSRGALTLITQRGRLVAILFADDLFMIAQNTMKLQLLLNGGCMFYTAASASLCAPKSKWTTRTQVKEWILRIGPFKDATQAAECATQCRKWRRQIGGNRTPNVERVQARSSEVLITGDIAFLVRSGIQCQWGEKTRPALRQASSLTQHLQDNGLAGVQLTVEHEPLYIVDPKSGEKGYLEYVPPDRPIRYLGYLICASLNWKPALDSVHAKLDRLLSQVRRGKQLGLPRDLFLQACNSKIGGMLGYYLVCIPTSEEEMTTINNKVAQAFSPCKDTSVHLPRMLPPIGLGVMDVELRTAQGRIKMATDTLHSNDVEGSALRWCLRVLQLVHHVPHFWWSDPRVSRTGAVRGFVEGVTQSLKVMELAILCTMDWFGRPPADSTLWERGFKPDTPERELAKIARRARTLKVYSLADLKSKNHLFDQAYRVPQDVEHILPSDPGPLYELKQVWLDKPVSLPPDTSMSDGSGQPNTTAAQLDSMNPRVGTVARVLSSRNVAVVGELFGLFLSGKRFIAEGVSNGTAISDCQGALGEVLKTRAVNFHPFRNTQQHCSLLRYSMWLEVGPGDMNLAWYPGHSEGSDVAPELEGVKEAQIETDRLAAVGQEPDMDPVRTTAVFIGDFPFVLVTKDGARAQGTLAQMVSRRRRDPSFHMQRRQQRRERAHGVSWVDIPTDLFHLPTIRTPFDSAKPWPSKLRSKYDAPAEREALLLRPMLARAAINGGGSHLTATRLDMTGGTIELATDVTTTTPAVMQRAICPFCVAQTEDSLQHLVWDCKSDRHLTATGKVLSAEETAKRTRQRFQSGMVAAMLGTGCPLLTGRQRPRDVKKGTVKSARSAQPLERKTRERKEATVVSYDVIRSIATAKIRAKLQHQPAHLWFQGKERAVEAGRARLRQAKRGGLKRTAATTALAVLNERLASTIADEKEGWWRRKGDSDVMPTYVDTPAKVSPALDCPTRGEEMEDADTALPESVLFEQALVASFYNLGNVEAVGIVPKEDGPWAGNTWTDLASARLSMAPAPALPTLRYGGLVDCRTSWSEARLMRRAAQTAGQPLLYIAIVGGTTPTARVGHALTVGDWLLCNEGRFISTQGYLMYVPGEYHHDPTGAGYLPATVRQWKRL